MGVTNLLQFLKPMQKCVSIKNYSGSVVAVDAMCWIHRGLISSAVAVVTGDSCDKYLKFIISMLALLLSHNITPIMVFDGYDTPAKERENARRREIRERGREEALEMIRKNKGRINSEIMRLCMRAVAVTPEIIARVIALCRQLNVTVVVAPFEADAQVAFLCRSGIAQVAISEDSDLLAYGCPRVWYKLERDGKADQVTLGFDSDVDSKATRGLLKGLSHRMFVDICILSGTDYDDGHHLNGLGIKLAHKFILQHQNLCGVIDALQTCPNWQKKFSSDLDFDKLKRHYCAVSDIFLHNIVYNFVDDELLHINPLDTTNPKPMPILGPMINFLKTATLNFNQVSQGCFNPKNGAAVEYSLTAQDLALVQGLSFKPLGLKLVNRAETLLTLGEGLVVDVVEVEESTSGKHEVEKTAITISSNLQLGAEALRAEGDGADVDEGAVFGGATNFTESSSVSTPEAATQLLTPTSAATTDVTTLASVAKEGTLKSVELEQDQSTDDGDAGADADADVDADVDTVATATTTTITTTTTTTSTVIATLAATVTTAAAATTTTTTASGKPRKRKNVQELINSSECLVVKRKKSSPRQLTLAQLVAN